ncbi:MAG: PilZ domain-containing protein, partial [Alphaproteobacteria bacterium]
MGNKVRIPADGVEKRKFKRMPTLFSGSLIDGDRNADVVVLDVSVNGAKLRVPADFECGPAVKLKIDRLGVFPAEVMWHKGNRLGLKFVDAPEEIARNMPGAFASKLAGESCEAASR